MNVRHLASGKADLVDVLSHLKVLNRPGKDKECQTVGATLESTHYAGQFLSMMS